MDKKVVSLAGALSLVAGLFVTAGIASASPPTASRVQDLAGCTANALEANDDESTDLVPLGFDVSLNGVVHSSVYVNNNGNVSFDRPYYEYTPFDFTASGSVMFAPFLADVDTRQGNVVTYGQTTVDGAAAFCVNWVDVGYYEEHVDLTNSFQLLMIDRGSGDFDLVYNYDRIAWETGDASDGSAGFGGTSAAAGLSTGDGVPDTNLMMPGSFVNGALLDGAANSLTAGGSNGAGSYLFPFRASELSGGLVRGLVLGNDGATDYPVSDAGVELCTSSGSCRVVTSDDDGRYSFVAVAPGTYTVRARSEYHAPASRTVTVTGDEVHDLDIALGASLVAVPDGWSAGGYEYGIPVVWTDQPTTVTSPPMCDGAGTWAVRANNAVVAQGALTKTPVPGSPGMVSYSAVIPALTANVTVARVTVEITCLTTGRRGPGTAAADQVVELDLVTAAPSVVVNRDGAPVVDAEVTLQRSSTATGVFADVLSGTSVLGWAPNPQYTDETGRVGWNTVAGFYRVVASVGDCTTTSPVRQVPVQAPTFTVTMDCSVPPTTTPTPTTPATPTPDPACAQKQTALATATAALTAAQQVLGQSTAKLQKATKKLAKAKKALKKAKKNGASGAKTAKLAKKVKKAKKAVKKAKAAKKASAASVATATAAVEAAKAALC